MGVAFTAERLHDLGAWGYGMAIVTEVVLPRVSGTDTPAYYVFDINDEPATALATIASVGSDWVIKYSCNGKNDFSHGVKRGDNSSLGRTVSLGRQTHEFVARRLERLFYLAPRFTTKVVFQELIDQSKGCLIHAELGRQLVDLEVLFNSRTLMYSHRALAVARDGGKPIMETSKDDELSSDEVAEVSLMMRRLQECAEVLTAQFACESWAVEGFWHSARQTLRFLQLRPTPYDRPVRQIRADRGSACVASRFTWGVCHKECTVRDGEVMGPGVLSLCRTERDPDWTVGYDAASLASFASGAVDTVVRSGPRGASRLSHEPWFLPPPEYRHSFSHVWLPSKFLHAAEGRTVRLSSDGEVVSASWMV